MNLTSFIEITAIDPKGEKPDQTMAINTDQILAVAEAPHGTLARTAVIMRHDAQFLIRESYPLVLEKLQWKHLS